MSALPKHIQLMDASRNALKPLFRIFLRSGISYKDFTEVAKSLFVEISTDEYGLRGRKTNISRVAIMTGLTRKEVKKIRDDGWEKMRVDKISNKLSPASAVLHFWHTDSDYQDKKGSPIPLAYQNGDPSFLTLAKKYGGDVPSGALFKELIRADAIEADGEKFYPVKRHFIAVEVDDILIWALRNSIRHKLGTVEYNTRPGRLSEERRFDRRVFLTVPKNKLKKVSEVAREKLRKYTEDLDDELSRFETGDSLSADKNSKIVGAGFFYFEDED